MENLNNQMKQKLNLINQLKEEFNEEKNELQMRFNQLKVKAEEEEDKFIVGLLISG